MTACLSENATKNVASENMAPPLRYLFRKTSY